MTDPIDDRATKGGDEELEGTVFVAGGKVAWQGPNASYGFPVEQPAEDDDDAADDEEILGIADGSEYTGPPTE